MITRFSERRIFRSSIHIHIGGSRSRSIDEQSGSLEFHLDPNTKKLVPAPPKSNGKEKVPEFIVKPRRLYIDEGEPAKFKASFEGSRDTELTWSVNGKPVISGARHKLYKENDCYMLEIPTTQLADQAVYVCKIENSAGAATVEAELEILVRPEKAQGKTSKFVAPTVDMELEDTEFVDREKDATLICKFHNAVDAKAFWFKDNKELSQWQAKAVFDGQTAKLVTREASRRTCGVYECVVRNSGGEAKTRCLVSLLNPSLKPTRPKFIHPLTNQTLDAGEKLVLEVEVTGKPRPTLTWFKNKMELNSSDEVRIEYKEGRGRLIVENLTQNEALTFSCVATNFAGEEVSHANVSVIGSEEEREPPIFTRELRDMEVNDGDRVEMSVEVKGTPPIDIVWVHNNREIPVTDPVCRMVNEGSVQKLVLPEVFPEDSGEYVCEAYNDYGDTDTFCRLTVNEVAEIEPSEVKPAPKVTYFSPEFVTRPEKVFVNTGFNAILKCRVSGEPAPSVLWSKGTTAIEHGDKYKITSIGDEHFLEISECDHEDSGQYTCTLNNIAGTVHVSSAVIVALTSSPKDLRFLLKKRSPSPACEGRITPTSSPTTFISPKLTTEDSGANNQIDFRGLLKKSPPKSHGSPNSVNSTLSDSNSDSDWSIKNGGAKVKHSGTRPSPVKLSNSPLSNRALADLSRKKQLFESASRPRSSLSTRSGYKVNKVLQKFESPTNCVQPEKGSSLQSRRENGTNLSLSITDRISRLKSPEKMDLSKLERKFTKAHSLESPKENSKDSPKESPKESPKSENHDRFLMRGKSLENPIKMTRLTDDFSRVTINQSAGESIINQSCGDAIISDSKPEFLTKLQDQSVKTGSEVILECELKDVPITDVSWEVNDKKVKQSKAFKMSYHDRIARLVVTEASKEDEGSYKCIIKNTSGTSSSTCRVSVKKDKPRTPVLSDTDDLEEPFSPTATPPKIYSISPTNFCILRGGTIQFKAFFTSVPSGKVTWSKNKETIISDDRIYTDTSEHCSTLTITEIQPKDSGKFTICVENKLGNDTSSACLTVEDVPDAPVGQPWVNEVTLTSVVLSWYGPAYDGGCPITNYRIEVCDAEEQEWTSVTNSCVSTTYKIENLSPLTPYFFRIFAENKHGVSRPCQTSEVTVTKERRPSLASRLNSVESDDVFTHETNDVCTPMFEYGIVSPLSPELQTDEGSNEEIDEIPFEHREVKIQSGRHFEQFYDCKEEIGKGKFGYVYKCIEKSTGKPWAAKILKCRESEKKKIQLEVEIMNQLKHPKILMLWDVFQAPRKMILVMELIGGGELFERVLDDDFELTERDCIQFMRQILDAVDYMHSRNILHLDLKPENILCIKNESNKIKIIDFGLARFYKPGENVRVLFGTPEFIAPEVVNYDEIGFSTDMWSIGVICYVLLTGLSPFMGDTDAETLANVTQGDFDFDDESFDNVSDDGKEFIEQLLVKNKSKRLKSKDALEHRWLAEDAARLKTSKINTKNLKRFMARRKWQKTGNAIRALGRMASLQKSNQSSPSNSLAGSPLSSGSSTLTIGSQGTIIEAKSDTTPFKVSDAEEQGVNTANTDPNSNNVSRTLFANKVSNGVGNAKLTKDINSNVDTVNQTNQNTVVSESKISSNGNFKSPNQNSARECDVNSASSQDKSDEVNNKRLRTNNDYRDKNYQCPEFTKRMVESKAFPGDSVRFDVAFLDKDSNPTVTWYFEDEVIHEDPRHFIQEAVHGNCSLIIKDICEDDDGEYSCKIHNECGEDTCSAELIVFRAI